MKHTITLLTALMLAPLAALHAAELTSLSLLKDIRVPSSAAPIRTAAQNAEPAKLDAWAQPLAAEPPAPWLEKQNIFEARTNSYWTCRIPGIAVTKRDVVLVTTEARPGRGGDYDFNDVLMRRSTDGGKTFGPIKRLVDHTTYGKGPVSNFVMIPDRDSSRIVAVFHHDYARAFTLHSDDTQSVYLHLMYDSVTTCVIEQLLYVRLGREWPARENWRLPKPVF